MGICWYCYWGWPKQIAEIYKKALKELDGYSAPLHFGPAHIVWDDENFDSGEWCLEHFDDYKGDYSEEEWFGPVPSGTTYDGYHTWSGVGAYVIKAQAVDINNAKSGWTTFTVTMPREKIFLKDILIDLIERILNNFSIFLNLK